jgi:hypothetical protein
MIKSARNVILVADLRHAYFLEIEMQIDEETGDGAKREKPRLLLIPWVKGEPLAYRCSRCCQVFLLPEDRTPKEGAAEVWAAFWEHVDKEHRDGARRTEGSGDDASGKT